MSCTSFEFFSSCYSGSKEELGSTRKGDSPVGMLSKVPSMFQSHGAGVAGAQSSVATVSVRDASTKASSQNTLVSAWWEASEEEDGAASRLARRCAARYGWSNAYARRVLHGYRQFLELKRSTQDWSPRILYPSPAVNAVWARHHDDDEEAYAKDCEFLCGRVVRRPASDKSDDHRREDRIRNTLFALQARFGDSTIDAEVWDYDREEDHDDDEDDDGPRDDEDDDADYHRSTRSPTKRGVAHHKTEVGRDKPPVDAAAATSSAQLIQQQQQQAPLRNMVIGAEKTAIDDASEITFDLYFHRQHRRGGAPHKSCLKNPFRDGDGDGDGRRGPLPPRSRARSRPRSGDRDRRRDDHDREPTTAPRDDDDDNAPPSAPLDRIEESEDVLRERRQEANVGRRSSDSTSSAREDEDGPRRDACPDAENDENSTPRRRRAADDRPRAASSPRRRLKMVPRVGVGHRRTDSSASSRSSRSRDVKSPTASPEKHRDNDDPQGLDRPRSRPRSSSSSRPKRKDVPNQKTSPRRPDKDSITLKVRGVVASPDDHHHPTKKKVNQLFTLNRRKSFKALRRYLAVQTNVSADRIELRVVAPDRGDVRLRAHHTPDALGLADRHTVTFRVLPPDHQGAT